MCVHRGHRDWLGVRGDEGARPRSRGQRYRNGLWCSPIGDQPGSSEESCTWNRQRRIGRNCRRQSWRFLESTATLRVDADHALRSGHLRRSLRFGTGSPPMAKLKTPAHRLRRVRARRGLALTEMALVLPLLLAITFAVMEYGWMFTKASQVANAARQGARVGARPNANAGAINTAIANAMAAGGMSNPGSGTPVYVVTITPL